jgi:very-short-patch-repair endonuclease/DNA-directed RNA polymerase subunit RPC12/RpoP
MNFKEAYPHLMKYWDYKRNKKLPEEVHSGGRICPVYFICDKGHSFQREPSVIKKSKDKGIKCPKCNINLFKDEFPYLVKYWDYKKNKIKLEDLTKGSREICYFICDKGHEMSKKASLFTKKNNQKLFCDTCSGFNVISETKLENTYPEVAKEYDLDKNREPLSEVSCNSNKDYWWKCEYKHSWKARVRNRTGSFDDREGHRCPYCWSHMFSRNETIIFSELHQFFKNVVSAQKVEGKLIDIFIKDFNLAIEYDGSYWHKDLNRDKIKNKLFKENGLLTLRVREYPLKKLEKQDVVYSLKDNLFDVIEYILNFIMDNYKIKKSLKDKINLYLKNKKATNYDFFESIKDQYKVKQITNPILFNDFDKEKNSLPLHYYGVGSGYKAFWRCNKCGIEYKKTIKNKNRAPDCGNCKKIEREKYKKDNASEIKNKRNEYVKTYSRKKRAAYRLKTPLVKKVSYALSITQTHPKILVELPIDRLEELKKISHTNSRIYFNTKCYNCKHEFKTNIWNKTKENQPCPNCNFNILLPETDLLKNHPNLMTEYHNENSIDLRYTKIEYPKLLKWLCHNGHITEKTIKNHIRYGDCLECNKGKKIIDIPRVIDTWDYEENNKLNLNPESLTLGSKKIANFKCSVAQDHLWSTKIIKRKHHNCPYCANQQISISNKLTVTHPDIAALWSSNNNSTPNIYMVGNGKTKFLWKCAYCPEEFSKEIVQMKNTDGMCSCCKTYNLGDNKGKKKGNR